VSIVSIPYNALLRWLLPDIYTRDTFVILNPYFTTGLLFVSVTTLVLFFVSGMYSEKISYANKSVFPVSIQPKILTVPDMSHILIGLFAHSICTSTPANPLSDPRPFGTL